MIRQWLDILSLLYKPQFIVILTIQASASNIDTAKHVCPNCRFVLHGVMLLPTGWNTHSYHDIHSSSAKKEDRRSLKYLNQCLIPNKGVCILFINERVDTLDAQTKPRSIHSKDKVQYQLSISRIK